MLKWPGLRYPHESFGDKIHRYKGVLLIISVLLLLASLPTASHHRYRDGDFLHIHLLWSLSLSLSLGEASIAD